MQSENANVIHRHSTKKSVLEFGDWKALILCFFLGFIIRLIPEVLSYPYPIGFDTIGYAASISTGKIFYHSGTFFEYPWTTFFSTWLLYAFLVPIYSITKIDPFLLLKSTSPILYAANVCAVYLFSRKWLSWSALKGLLAALFFTFQLASLRISWDLYRNSLAMIFLLLALPLIYKANNRKGIISFALLSLLVVFSHELVAAVLLTMIFGMVVFDLIKCKSIKRLLKVLFALLPALTIFLLMTLTMLFQYGFAAEPNIISAHNPPPFHPFNLFFIENYFKVASPMENYPTYFSLISDVFSLFGILYLPWLPLVALGFFRDKILDVFSLVLLAFTFSCIIIPFFAIFQWSRWMYLLAYPFTFYATNGAAKRSHSSLLQIKSKFNYIRSFSPLASVTFLIAILLSVLFMVAPAEFAVFSIGRANSYFPSTMQHNTIPLQDQNDLIETIKWLNTNATKNASILVHHALLPWTRLYLSENFVRIYYISNIKDALNLALQKGFDRVYLIWWNTNVGWYGITVPHNFHEVFKSGRLSVFQYFYSSAIY